MEIQKTAEKILQGQIGVMPTDTIYGIVASALGPAAVERVYQVKQRDASKACIVLIADIADLDKFGIQVNEFQKDFLNQKWPGKNSVILSIGQGNLERLQYLHRGQDSISFRLPDNNQLRELIRATGPLVAPSANPEGKTPAATVNQAREYFDDQVDFYIDGGKIIGNPSNLFYCHRDRVEQLR